MTIVRGVAKYEGIFTDWYGWARGEGPQHYGYLEGPPRLLKTIARIDAFRVARILRKHYR